MNIAIVAVDFPAGGRGGGALLCHVHPQKARVYIRIPSGT